MAITWSRMIFTLVSQAQRGTQAAQWNQLDTQGIAETLMPTVFQKIGEMAAGDERKRSLLKRTVSLSFTNGSATIPDYVLTQYLEDATYTDNDDLTKKYSWVREFSDFIDSSLQNPPWSNLGYYNVTGGVTIRQIEAGVPYNPSSGITDTRSLNIPCVPVRPATAATDVDIPDEILSDIFAIGSELLRGEVMKKLGIPSGS